MKKPTPDFRMFVLKRDKFRCCRCGKYYKNGRRMIAYTFNQGSTDTDDYKALCRTCEAELLRIKPQSWRDVKESADDYGIPIPRYSQEEVARADAKKQECFTRPEWHAYVYGISQNPRSSSSARSRS